MYVLYDISVRRSAFEFNPPHLSASLSTHAQIDSYSAFLENDHKTPTGLTGYSRERGLTRVFLAGLALDFCVRYSAEDAHRSGLSVVVLEDACRAIDNSGSLAETWNSLAALGIPRIRGALGEP